MPDLEQFLRRTRSKVVYLVPVLLTLALGAWVFASPVGSSPDDDFHLASIWCANPTSSTACLPGPTAESRYVPESLHEAPLCYRFHPEISAACQDEAFSFDPSPTLLTDRGSFAGNYPPVYYFVMSAFVGPDIVASVIIMRFVNVLLFVGMTTLLYALLPVKFRIPFTWSWLICIVPLGAFLIASNNPSAWALIGVGTVWAALLGFFESHGRRKVALGALVTIGVIMAAGSRADAAIYAGISIALVLFLAFRRSRQYFLQAILPIGLGILSLVLFLGSGQASVAVEGLGSIEDVPERTLDVILKYNIFHVPDVLTGSFGSWQLGWLDVDLPPVVMFLTASVFAGIIFAGISFVTPRKIVALASLTLVLIALPIYVLTTGGNIVGEVLQPRYLLPLIVVFAGLALLPVGLSRLTLTRLQMALVAISLIGANAVALHVNMRRYISGNIGGGFNLNHYLDWWWDGFAISPMIVWIVGVITFGAAVSILVWELSKEALPRTEVTSPSLSVETTSAAS